MAVKKTIKNNTKGSTQHKQQHNPIVQEMDPQITHQASLVLLRLGGGGGGTCTADCPYDGTGVGFVVVAGVVVTGDVTGTG